MLILKSIGAFFVRIWRWIKETAWVQPLLIVGAVFAVIFSIPSLTDWINQNTAGDGSFYWESTRLRTLNGETNWSTDGEEVQTVADDMTGLLTEALNDTSDVDAVNAVKNAYGEKFFFLLIGDECQACLNDEGGFKELNDKWNSAYVPSSVDTLRIYTINADETSSNDDDYSKAPYDTAFKRYLNNWGTDFFEPLGSYLFDTTAYVDNASVAESEYEVFSAAAIEGESIFTTPVYLLFDFTDEAIAQERVAEATFSALSGSTNVEKANFLLKMWNHLDLDINNIFSTSYRA